MPPPGLQISLWPPVTLTFDFLRPEVDRFMGFPCGLFVPTGSFICFQNIVFGIRQIDG